MPTIICSNKYTTMLFQRSNFSPQNGRSHGDEHNTKKAAPGEAIAGPSLHYYFNHRSTQENQRGGISV